MKKRIVLSFLLASALMNFYPTSSSAGIVGLASDTNKPGGAVFFIGLGSVFVLFGLLAYGDDPGASAVIMGAGGILMVMDENDVGLSNQFSASLKEKYPKIADEAVYARLGAEIAQRWLNRTERHGPSMIKFTKEEISDYLSPVELSTEEVVRIAADLS